MALILFHFNMTLYRKSLFILHCLHWGLCARNFMTQMPNNVTICYLRVECDDRKEQNRTEPHRIQKKRRRIKNRVE